MGALYFLALFFVALALVPAGAHVAELVHKMPMDAREYQTVQQIYRGWALFGIVVIGALVSLLLLTIRLRRNPRARTPALIALLSIAATQVVFWTFTYPVNQATANWTIMPPDWMDLRARWEYSHAASAAFNLVALVAMLISVLRYRVLERDAHGAA